MSEMQTPPCGGVACALPLPSPDDNGRSLANKPDTTSSGDRPGRSRNVLKRALRERPAWGIRRSATEPGPHHEGEVTRKRVALLCMEEKMTIEEAAKFAGWIQQAFPHMKMEAKLYIRALVHYDHDVASKAILDAITNLWKRMPNVAEVVEVIRETMPPPSSVECETCHGDRLVLVGAGAETGDGEYAPCPSCHRLSGSDYFLAGIGKNYRATPLGLRPLDPPKVRELMGK